MPPMPPTPESRSLGLLSTYKQYKADTEIIAGWLKANAVKHGYKFDRRDGTSIRTSDFVPMAQQIVSKVKAFFTLHPAIHDAFRRAIVARNKCSAWYEKNTKGQWKSNQSHAYFTNILLTSWDILLSASATRPEPNHRASQAEAPDDNSAVPSNRFAALYINKADVDDDGDGDTDNDDPEITNGQSSSSTNKSPQGKNSRPSYTPPPATIIPDETQIEGEFWFAIQTFLKEQQKVRELVKGYWKDFRADKTHLAMATFGTRMAIDLIRRSEIELGLQVNRPKRFPEDKYPVHVFPALLIAAQQPESSPMSLDDLLDPDFGRLILISGPQNDLTLYNAYATLKSLCKVAKYGVDPKTVWPDWSEEHSRLQDKLFMFFRMIFDQTQAPWQDDITRGVKDCFKSGEVPIWTTFALRLLLDIEDILDEERMLPWRDATYHTLYHRGNPPTHWHHQSGCRHLPLEEDYSEDESLPKEPPDKHQTPTAGKTMSMLEKVRSSEGPRMKGMVKKRLPKKKLSKAAQAAKAEEDRKSCEILLRCGYDRYENDVHLAYRWVIFEIIESRNPLSHFDALRSNPLHCGMIQYDLNRSRQWSALHQNAYNNRDIWTMMYIYAAGRSVFPDSLAWPDMEFLLYLQDDRHVFFGGRPADLQWAARKWMLAMGNSLNDYSYRDLSHLQCCGFRFSINPKKWRPLKDNSVMNPFISSQMNCCDHHRAKSRDHYLEMIRKMHTKKPLSRLARLLNMSQHATETFVTTWTSRLHAWTLADILELTQIYLAVDLVGIGFNWAAFDSTCSQMWKEARPLVRLKHSRGDDDACNHEDCDIGNQPSHWATIILSQAAVVESNLSSKTRSNPTVLAEELEKGSPAFMKLWTLIQQHCRKRVNVSLGHGIFSRFAGEQCLVRLLDDSNDPCYPARIVAPHVPKCFEGYPEHLAKQSAAMILAEKVLASDIGTLRVLKKTTRNV
ncbi:hypothetical protein Daus18300_011157 [Diaporthe australafricana]|uniref:DUF6604 domain-containing protein n=1 Tax=Diaporthe australafricana TaxID=127596 RepID=A0ABR3W826_9PEZI